MIIKPGETITMYVFNRGNRIIKKFNAKTGELTYPEPEDEIRGDTYTSIKVKDLDILESYTSYFRNMEQSLSSYRKHTAFLSFVFGIFSAIKFLDNPTLILSFLYLFSSLSCLFMSFKAVKDKNYMSKGVETSQEILNKNLDDFHLMYNKDKKTKPLNS